jgi:hypothetical protein
MSSTSQPSFLRGEGDAFFGVADGADAGGVDVAATNLRGFPEMAALFSFVEACQH